MATDGYWSLLMTNDHLISEPTMKLRWLLVLERHPPSFGTLDRKDWSWHEWTKAHVGLSVKRGFRTWEEERGSHQGPSFIHGGVLKWWYPQIIHFFIGCSSINLKFWGTIYGTHMLWELLGSQVFRHRPKKGDVGGPFGTAVRPTQQIQALATAPWLDADFHRRLRGLCTPSGEKTCIDR